jgi:hypothetical protein
MNATGSDRTNTRNATLVGSVSCALSLHAIRKLSSGMC